MSELIQHLHASETRVVLAITGGGSRAIGELLEVPGSSRTLLSALVPYSAAALVEWLGVTPEQFCSERTARMMAIHAWNDARRLAGDESTPLAGIGCTASLASDRPKRGAHRVHVAWQTADATGCVSLELLKDHRTRKDEEILASSLVLNMLAEASGVSDRKPLTLLEGERIERGQVVAPREWRPLVIEPEVRRAVPLGESARSSPPHIVFPGAFHPRHAGHSRMASLAAQRLGGPVDFEIAVTNVDKPPLDYVEMRERADQFAGERLWFTSAPTFVAKAKLFPGATFVVGLDTIVRIADRRYYGGDAEARDEAIDQLAAAGCKFLVFGRRVGDAFQTLSTVTLPPKLAALCEEVSEQEFREDLSSTELRRSG